MRFRNVIGHSLALLLLAGCTPAAPAARQGGTIPPAVASEVRHVVIVILENEDETRSVQQPFLAQLASRGALLRNYHAVAHPSQPNYIALISGSTHSVRSDRAVTIDAPHLGDLLEARHFEWKVYAEDYPGDCYLGSSRGFYVRKHVPFLSFVNVQRNEARCAAHVFAASQLDRDVASESLPQFALYVPNLINDGHNTNVRTADAWLKARFGPLLQDRRFTDGTLFIVTFDEGRTWGPNIVYCALFGAGIRPGAVSDAPYSHYDLLRTVEDILQTGTLHQHDAAASPISDVWQR